MPDAIGPQRFVRNFEAEAKQYMRRIVQNAQGTSESQFTMDMNVETAVRSALKSMLISAGFSNITFDSSYQGHWITVSGNPYAAQNTDTEVENYVGVINGKLGSATVSGKSVFVDVKVPQNAQPGVRNKFIAAGWSSVTFNSDQRDGDSVTLSM